MSATYNATSPGLEAACAQLAASNDPKLPLVRAAADRRIALAWAVRPDAKWPFKTITPAQPAVVLIGDDPGPEAPSIGPEGWVLAKRLRGWPQAVIVHGAAGQPEHYREAVFAALVVKRVIMVETDSAHALAWGEWFRCPRTLMILPTGGAHPVAPARGAFH